MMNEMQKIINRGFLYSSIVLMVFVLLMLFLSGCGGDSGSAQGDYCGTFVDKYELCFGSLSNPEVEIKACVDTNCPNVTDAGWNSAEGAVMEMSCSQFESFILEGISNPQFGSGCS